MLALLGGGEGDESILAELRTDVRTAAQLGAADHVVVESMATAGPEGALHAGVLARNRCCQPQQGQQPHPTHTLHRPTVNININKQ